MYLCVLPDVVDITKGVHIEYVDIGWQQEQVLRKAGNHVPWIEIEQTSYNVQAIGSQQ